MDWSPTEEGRLVTGDCGNCVYVTRAAEGGWATDPVPFVGHVASVEDLQWSPTETTVSLRQVPRCGGTSCVCDVHVRVSFS